MFIKTLALLMLAIAEPGEITGLSMTRIVELAGPVVVVGANGNKIPAQMDEAGRWSVPMPASLLVFNESGCLTAILRQNDLSRADGKCLEGEQVPTIGDFLGETSSKGSLAIIILSPLYNLTALKSVNSSRDAFVG